MDHQQKRCAKCKNWKPLDAFRKDRGRRDGLYPYCRACESTWHKAQREANPEKYRARGRAYKAANHEKVLEYNHAYREAHREELRAKGRVYSKTHREKGRINWQRYYVRHKDWMRNRVRAYTQANREEISERTRQRRQANPEIYRAKKRAFREANPEKIRAYDKWGNARRNAKLSNAEGKFTSADILRLYDLQEGRCAWCSEDLSGKYHIDHVVPLSRGGSNWPDNLVLACPYCNMSKQDKLVYEEWQPPKPLGMGQPNKDV